MSHLHEQRFVDDTEMAEILANEKLLARLREGSAQTRVRRGRFVR